MNVINAAAVFMPMVRALMVEAESTGAKGQEKLAAVSEGAEKLYRTLQETGRVKEIKDVPWELVAPILVPVVDGVVGVLVKMFNRLMGKIWPLFGRAS